MSTFVWGLVEKAHPQANNDSSSQSDFRHGIQSCGGVVSLVRGKEFAILDMNG